MLGTIQCVSGPPFEMVFQEVKVFVYARASHCQVCTRVTDPSQAIAPDDMPVPTFDVSATLDGAVIATDAFRDICREVPGVTFTPLEGAVGCWLVDVDQVVRLEPFDSHVRWGLPCEACGRPRYAVRSGPLRLNPDEVLPTGFSHTDVEFGDTADFGFDRPVLLRPSLLVDRGTGRLLKSSGLLGIHLITQP
jgi:hypothetical protein